jgi:hypothetical protein
MHWSFVSLIFCLVMIRLEFNQHAAAAVQHNAHKSDEIPLGMPRVSKPAQQSPVLPQVPNISNGRETRVSFTF